MSWCRFEPLPDGRIKCRRCGRPKPRTQANLDRELRRCRVPPVRGLGDWLSRLLARIGLTPERISRWQSYGVVCGGGATAVLVRPVIFGQSMPCGCRQRAEQLNRWFPFRPPVRRRRRLKNRRNGCNATADG